MKQRDLLFITASSFVLVLFWVFFSVYNSFVTSTINDALSTQIAPINPSFDTSTLNKLQKRVHIDPFFQASQSAEPAVVTPAPTPITVATSPSQSPQATSAGQIIPTPAPLVQGQ